MAAEVVAGRPLLSRLQTTRSGAITQNSIFGFDPSTIDAYRSFLGAGFEAVQIMSPVNSAGAADLEIRVGGFVYTLAGGGNVVTLPGPIASMTIKALNAAVGGTGSDDVLITPVARLKTGGL